MTRGLTILDAADRAGVLRALRDALGGGPAVLPLPPQALDAGTDLERPASGADPAAPPLPAEVPQRVAVVIETSGSTGTPKRVALSADALLASAAASASALGGAGQWLLCLPAHYVAGVNVLVRSLAAETEPVLLPAGHFDARAFVEAARAMTGDGRYVSLVPVQLARLVELAGSDRGARAVLRRFDGILVGGQALRPDLRERAGDLGLAVARTYGSSETCGGCVYDGVPFAGVTARRADEGMLELAGPVLAEGYLGDDARTEAAFRHADGLRWYRTGDLGTVDAVGRVTVLGRADHVIISGGEKVLLDAVERTVRLLPGFGAAVVIGVEDATWGQVPVVVVEREAPDVAIAAVPVAADPAAAGPAAAGPVAAPSDATAPAPPDAAGALTELRHHVAASLGRAAAPARILAVPSIPLLPSGKPDRRALARLAASALA